MSLRLWLPLNGSTVNNGTISETVTGSPTWEEGKIGQCATFSSTSHAIVCNTDKLYYANTENPNQDFSYCMWLKKDYGSSQMWAFSVGRAGNESGGYGYGIRIYETYLRAYFGSGYHTVSNFPDNEWHHLAYVKSGTNIKIYLDAVKTVDADLASSVVYPSYNSSVARGLGVGCLHYSSNAYTLNGSISDFRIYDHALSQAEIIEIKKALILHLPLDNPYATGIQNLYSDDYAKGSSSSSSFTKTKLANEDGYNYSLTYTGTGSNYYPNIKFPTISRTLIHPGKKYTWSCKIRVNTWSSTSGTPKLSMRSSIKSNDTTNGSVTAANASYADGEWRTISRTITLSEGMVAGSTYYYITTEAYNASTETSKAYMTPLVEFYTNNLNVSGAVYTFNIDIKEIQLIESDEYPGWIDNRFVKNCVRDISGFGNDGTCSGSVTTMSDAPRYDKCYQFDGTSSYIGNIPQVLRPGLTEFTISFWVYFNSSQYITVFSDYIDDRHKQIRLSISENNIYFRALRGEPVVSGAFEVYTSIPINQWHHIVLTMNADLYKVYVDNIKVGEDTCITTLSPINNVNVVGYDNYSGNILNGKLSDLRVYATELTADQVKELYNAPISVSDKGSLLCCECTETDEDGTRAFKSTGVVESYQAAEIVSGTPVDHFSIVKTNYNGIGIKTTSIMEQ